MRMVSSPQAQMEKSLYSERHVLLAELLREARKKSDLTQQEVADRLGKPQSFVAKYENGERRLDVVEFVDIAKVLAIDPGALIQRIIISG